TTATPAIYTLSLHDALPIYVSNLMHCVFSTKKRLPLITPELEAHLWPYIGGIARENRMKAIAIGGTADHLHALLSLPATISFAKAVQLIKGVRLNGFMTPSTSIGNSHGSKNMVPSASVHRKRIKLSP